MRVEVDPVKLAKLWFTSKTVLFNIAAILAIAVQVGAFGEVIPLEYQAVALAIANLVLRFVTRQGVTVPSTTDAADAVTVVTEVAAAVKGKVLRK